VSRESGERVYKTKKTRIVTKEEKYYIKIIERERVKIHIVKDNTKRQEILK